MEAYIFDETSQEKVLLNQTFELNEFTSKSNKMKRGPFKHKEITRKDVEKMLKAGIIGHVNTSLCFKVETESNKYGRERFYIGHRSLN